MVTVPLQSKSSGMLVLGFGRPDLGMNYKANIMDNGA